MRIVKKRHVIEPITVYDITVEDVHHYILENGLLSHNSQGMFPTDIQGGGSGPELAADTILFISKAKEKEGKEVIGFNFNLRINKSRFVKENAVFPLHVTFEDGVDKLSSMFEFAKEKGYIVSPSQGWYSRPNVAEDKKWRMKEIDEDPSFWDQVITPEFKAEYEQKYRL